MNMKKIVSLLLALAMVFGMVTPPSQVHANGDDEFVEADYKVENVDGTSYKVYKFTDIVGTPESNKQFEIDGLDVSEPKVMPAVRGSNPALGEELSYSVEVQWTTYDIEPKDVGIPIFFQIRDTTTGKFIAQTENITGKIASKVYKFYKLPAWDESGVSHNAEDWDMRVPVDYKFDVRLQTGAEGAFESEDIVAKVAQRANPIYRAEYYTNKDIPKIVVERTDVDNNTSEVPINDKNLSTKQFYSWAKNPKVRQTYRGIFLEILQFGQTSLDDLKISDDITSGRTRMKMKAPGKTEFDRGPGTFEDNGTPYHYEVTGDHIKAHIFTIRQDLKVKFDPNGGTWKNSASADQTIGHSMKLADSWAGLGPINVPGAGDLTPPAAKPGEKEKKFIGWNTDANATTALFTDNTYDTPITKDETFYAIYAEKPQGKVAIQYVDEKGTAIKDIYKVQGVDYPKFAEGNKGENVDAKSIPQPAFIGYERSGDIVVTDKKYDENGRYTVEVPYKKLDSIIPAKDGNGEENPKVTEDVKKHYAKVTYQVDTKDAEKAKLQLDNADAKSPLVYYVNPVEGIAIKDVANVAAVSNDANLYKVDVNDMWTYDPNTITGTDYKIVQAKDTQNKVVKTEITLTAKVADKTAVKFKDKLKPVDIKVWEDKTDTDGSKIDWKKGVELKEANADLKNILDKAETKVTDESNRNSSNANLPNGQKGNLKVTFEDGSSLEVKDQTLYVAPHKNDDNTNLPKDAVKVEFKIGEGVKGTAKTEYVKPGTDVKADAPAVTLKEGFKDAKWYKGEATTEATANDYKVTENAVFTAKATGKDKVVKLDDPVNPTNFPKDPTDNNKKDADYVTVKFVADANGKIKEGDAEKANGIAYAVLKNTEWADALTAGVVVPKADAEGNAPKLVGNGKFYSFKEWQKDKTKVTEFAKVGNSDVTYTAVFGKADEFSVTYNLNAPEGLTVGGTAPTDNTKYLKDEQVTVKALAADNTLAGYKFTGWNTQADGKGTTHAANATFKIEKNTELFAQWEKTAKDVIPVDNENDKKGKNGEEIPDNYVFVEFKVKDADVDKAEIKANQQAKFKVDPKATVTLTAPALELKDAYKDTHIAKFNEADYTNKVFAQKTTIWASVTEKGKVTVKYVFNTNPANKTLPKDLADLKPTDITTPIYEDKVVDPAQPDTSSEAAQKALVEKDKDGKEVGTWTPGTWVKSGKVEDGVFTYTLTWTFTEAGKPVPQPEQPPMPDYNPWWPIWFGSTKTEVKKEEPKHLERHDAYIAGYPDGTVRPDGKITRAEVSAIFARLTENSAPANYSPKFSDVLAYDWFCDSVMKLSNKDIIKGYPDGTFKPNKSITRAEFAVIASKYIKNPKAADETFSDVPMNHWAKDAIAMVKAEGWISGYTDGTFKPDAPITRAEAVSIVNRMFDRAADGEFVREHGFEIKKFNDLTDKHWAYYEIMEAVHTHDYERIDKRTEKWEKIVK
ncbi:hypothetical protein HMPREF9225_1811 [Peptoniphilus duerdenii ATCC BAA-1640]|uniref:SLH domain-containing protein n=1 Tax=Peptoniphilus duerdenii ATCC BAA-1640 TaxID=862517 RepID=E0NNS2_9FIRM|nr:S-layer homology domain-containing protein [Peptoniphilus duerdenii]EFM24575.1 hypothetical protein HMPREF9225_1811 [Peptoniphilus duerdenii ATCC BAA-1640]